MTIPKLSKEDETVLVAALRTAAETHESDEQAMRQVERDISNGKSVPMFVAGTDGVRAAKRLADQHYRQAQAARELLKKFGDDES